MSYYTHILICWEGGHVVGYADPEKIKSIASKYFDIYKSYVTEYDKLMLEEEIRRNAKKEKLNEDEIKRCRDLENLIVTSATMSILENISSGKAYFKGSKGCLWISGGIYNYTSGYTVLEELKDFFKELWDNRCFGIGNVICLHESEQSREAQVLVLDADNMDIHEVEKGEKWCWGLNW